VVAAGLGCRARPGHPGANAADRRARCRPCPGPRVVLVVGSSRGGLPGPSPGSDDRGFPRHCVGAVPVACPGIRWVAPGDDWATRRSSRPCLSSGPAPRSAPARLAQAGGAGAPA
jgi:hypothetical protein